MYRKKSITELAQKTGVKSAKIYLWLNGKNKTCRPENWSNIYPLLKPYLPDDARYVPIMRNSVIRSDMNGYGFVNFVGSSNSGGIHIVNDMQNTLSQIQAISDSHEFTPEEKSKFIAHLLQTTHQKQVKQ